MPASGVKPAFPKVAKPATPSYPLYLLLHPDHVAALRSRPGQVTGGMQVGGGFTRAPGPGVGQHSSERSSLDAQADA